MSNSYRNYEDDENIICPYCGQEYEPSYEDTYIGDKLVDCYTEEKKTYTCNKCGKKFTMYGYRRDGNILQKPLTEKQRMMK